MPAQKPSPKSKAPLKAIKSSAKKAIATKAAGVRVSTKAEDGVPLSTIIRRRIQAKKARFHANDNISQFIEPGDLEGLVDEVAVKMQAVLETALIGLSKYSRLTEWVMCRPQIQEEAVVHLADMLEKKIRPVGVAIVMDADHFCMQWRGVKDRDSKMVNSVMRGAFLKDANLRREFLALMDRR
jgi:hypothetical protein